MTGYCWLLEEPLELELALGLGRRLVLLGHALGLGRLGLGRVWDEQVVAGLRDDAIVPTRQGKKSRKTDEKRASSRFLFLKRIHRKSVGRCDKRGKCA